MPRVLSWLPGGLLLGTVFLATVVLVTPIGVSTQFVIFDAVLWDLVNPDIVKEVPGSKSGFGSTNAYLNEGGGGHAKNAANPLNYSFVFVLAMMLGAFLSSVLGGDRPGRAQQAMPDVWRSRFGDKEMNRYIAVFLAGFIVLFGARLADGCTSGHMMSGMMQTAVSGYLFALGAFAAGVPVAIVLYRQARSN